jgi:tetratricopeptide (TPR) repeat protein
MKETDILRAELERLFELDELIQLSRDILGFEPEHVGGTAAKASFAGALTAHCAENEALEALCDALLATRANVSNEIQTLRSVGLYSETEIPQGESFGPFSGLRKLGEGRLAVSYVGERGDISSRIRVLRSEATRDRRGLQRFLTVSRLISSIDHPGLPRGLQVGEIGGRVFVAHEHVAGITLAEHLASRGPLPIEEAHPLARALLEALSALHAKRIPHGDLRLENVIVVRSAADSEPGVVLLDAGSDRLRSRPRLDNGRTELFATIGSPRSVSPEQIRGQASTPASDVYSFGALFYQMLTGKPPFGEAPIQAAFGHISQAPPAASESGPRGWISAELDAFLSRLLAKEPSARPADAAAALALLLEVGRVRSPSIVTVPPEDLDSLIATLVKNPEDDGTALSLESAAETPELSERIASVLLTASNELEADSAPEALEARKSLLFRGARVCAAWPETRPRAEEFYAKLLEIAPDDDLAHAGLIELRRRLGKHEEVVELLLARAEKLSARSEKARTFAEIGRIYSHELGDREQALVAFAQALSEDPGDAEIAAEIERLAAADSNAWNEVLESISSAAHADDLGPEQKALLLGRAGRWWMERLHRSDLALPCFQGVVALEPGNDAALEGLSQIYRKAQQWSELGAVLIRRADAAPTPAHRRNFQSEAAELLDIYLNDAPAARALLEEIVEQDPGHPRASQHLAKLYERIGDHSALVRLLERSAEGQRGEERTKTLCRIAELYEANLDDELEARRRYNAVLDQDPHSLEALRGLERLFSKSGRYQELLDNLERQIESSATPRQKLGLLERVSAIYDEEFLDHDKAAEALERLLEIDPAHERALTALVRHYRAQDRWEDVAAVLDRHQKSVSENARRIPLLVQLAKVLSDQIGSPQRAISAYEAIIRIEPEHAAALEALAKLRESAGDADAALSAIEALAAQAQSADAKADQWIRAAKLLDARGDRDGAIERYKRALDARPADPVATAGLREAFAARGDAHAAIQLIERELEHTEGALAKAKLAGQMAILYRARLRDAARAEQAAKRAVELDPTNLDALVVLGDIAFDEGRFVEAAKYFEVVAGRTESLERAEASRILVRYVDALTKTGESERALVPTELLMRLAPDDLEALDRVAQVTFQHGSAERAAALYGDLLSRFSEQLNELSRASALYRRGESLRRAGKVAEGLPALEEAAELDPSSPEPLIALARTYEALERWTDLIKVRTRHLDIAPDDERVDILTDIGDVAASKLGDRTQAAKSYVAALDERPNDRKLLTKLMQLYSEEKDWNKLVEVVLRLAEFVDDPKQKVKYLHTAAIVTGRQVGDPARALEFYSQVLELDPGFDKAIQESVELYRERGEFKEVERLLRRRLELATKAEDRPTLIATFDALGALYEKDLNLQDQAIDALEAAHTLDPDDKARAQRLAALYSSDPARYLDKAVSAELDQLQKNPFRVESYRTLRRLYTETKKADAAWCLCQALSVLKLSEPDEERFYKRMRAETAAPAQSPIADEDWLTFVMHPASEPLLSSLFALIEPVVIAKRGQPLSELGFDEAYRMNLAVHPAPLCQSLYFAAGVLGLEPPPVYENPNDPAGISFLFSHLPSLVLGSAALSPDLPLQPAAFLAAHKLAYLRPGMYVRHLLASGTALKAWLFAAIKLTSPQFPVAPELEGAVLEAVSALEAGLQGPARDHLTRVVAKLLTSGAALDLKRWVAGIDLTADRAGLIICHDLEMAARVIRASDDGSSSVPADERIKELVLYSVSPAYFTIRSRLSISRDS